MVAQAMFQCALKPRCEVLVGNSGRMVGSMHDVAPRLVEPMMARQIDVGHFQNESAPPTSGTLFEPMTAGDAVSDGWHGQEKTNGRRVATVVAGVVAPVAIAGAWFWPRRHND